MGLDKYSELILEFEQINNRFFNIFKVLKQEEYENKHSTFLSWLFNINASHGLGASFAEKFFEKAIGEDYDIDCSKIRWVKTEQTIAGTKQKKEGKDKKRIDILIEGDKFTCTIENKYGSVEHGNQCLDYREYIEGRKNSDEIPEGGQYPIADGWKNYFVFLDIEKPDDFEEQHKKRYGDYCFISYQTVKEILERLIEGKDDSIEILFIKQYIEILKEKYEPLKNEFVSICEQIPDDDITEIISYAEEKKYEALTEAERLFVSIVKKYYYTNKSSNYKYIKEILIEIVKDPNLIQDYNGTGRKTDNGRHAYGLRVYENNQDGNPIVQGFAEKSQYDILKSVDYTVSNGINIGIYAGMNTDRSRKLINYINDNTDFMQKIRLLSEKGWNCRLMLSVLKSHNSVNHALGNIVCELECNLSDLNDKDCSNLVDFIKNNTYNIIGKKKNTMVYDYLNSVKKTAGFVKIDEAKTKLEEYIEYIYNKNVKRGKIVDKSEIEVVVHWLVLLNYPLKENNKNVYKVSESNKDFVKQQFVQKTNEGLNLYGIGDKYAEACFRHF